MGGWCSLSEEGERMDVTNSSLEEGDGAKNAFVIEETARWLSVSTSTDFKEN
jgi:hypothetical protein